MNLLYFLKVFFLFCYINNLGANEVKRSLGRNDKPSHEEQGRYHHRMYTNETHHHTKAWEVLAEVDGLKNEDIVTLITSSAIQEFVYIRGRIIQSARTWMRVLANVFVIVEDTFKVRFAMRFCSMSETPHFTTFTCHNEPTYILTRKCTNQYYGGPGPCCKVDELLTYLMVDRPELFAHTKYVIHGDDDTYFRIDQLMHWFAAIENSGINTYPIIANGNFNDPKENVWHIKGCTEIHTNGWYQPMILNHAALERMKVAVSSYGLTATCSNFDVTHDVGVGPFAWLFGLYHIHIPHMWVGNGGPIDNSDMLIVHSIKHGRQRDNCNNASNYDEHGRYDQAEVVGCGQVGKPIMGHDENKLDYNGEHIISDMYDAWAFYRDHGRQVDVFVDGEPQWANMKVTLYPNGTMLPGISTTGDENKVKIKHVLTETDVVGPDGTFNGDPVVERYIPKILQLKGYEGTKHSKENDITKVWKEFTMKDCVVEGHVGY